MQAEAIDILMYQDEIERLKANGEKLKLALAARAEYLPDKMFPDFFGKTEEAEDAPDDDETEYDYSAVEWKGPSDSDKEELANILRMLQEASGSVDMNEAANIAGGGRWV